jgi:protein TonB
VLLARLQLEPVGLDKPASQRPRPSPLPRTRAPRREDRPADVAGNTDLREAGIAGTATEAAALPALDLPAPDLTWYPARQLDVFPTPLAPTTPQYPATAAVQGVTGEVTLLVLIDEAGSVREVSVAEAHPAGYFEAAAVAAYERARFEPAQKDGRAVRAQVLVRVAFGL